MKRIIMILTAALMLMSASVYAEDAQTEAMYFNGEELSFDCAPVTMENGEVYLPMRPVFEAAGASVAWEGDTNTVYSVYDGGVIVMQIDNPNFYVNSEKIEKESGPVMLNDRTYISIDALSSVLPVWVSENPYLNAVFVRKAETIAVKMSVKDMGDITVALMPSAAPVAAANFLNLTELGFYNGLKFHRVVKDFVIQGGDPNGDGTGGAGYTIIGEFAANGYENPVSHTKGVVSMARSSENNSASSQFFIVLEDSLYLDGNYAAFAEVVEGMDIVEKIGAVEIDESDTPKEDVVITEMKVIYNYELPA